ncbi:FK506-binding protein-like isoform X2 [Monodelphis domestica]|uniref:FK506-binding protein-like isoform X2 n=1 Tax=Monodelphis domestica TaxID=13616 RepID=UPI0024E1E4DD|nr:FK506-binding protein-like isoform X2 [Monodelphis domestica]
MNLSDYLFRCGPETVPVKGTSQSPNLESSPKMERTSQDSVKMSPEGSIGEKDIPSHQEAQQGLENTKEEYGVVRPRSQDSGALTAEALGVGADPDAQIPQTEDLQEFDRAPAGMRGDPLEPCRSTSEMSEPHQSPILWHCPDGSFVKRIMVQGQGLDKPKGGSQCQVLVSGLPPGVGLPEGWTELTMGSGPWRDSPWGEILEKCLETMCSGEQAELMLPGGAEPPALITLASFTLGKDSWELSVREKEELASEERVRGTELFRAGNPEAAARCYGRALRLLLTLPPPGPPERIILHANLAACQLQLGQPTLAAQSCDRVLERDPRHVKALYRRGVARAAFGELDGAAADLRRVLELEPGNRAAREELGRVVIRGREQDAGLARGLRKMFS